MAKIRITKKLTKYCFSRRTEPIKYIVVHGSSVINQSRNAQSTSDYFCSRNRQESYHYYIDDLNIIQTIEDKNTALHSSDAGVNDITNENSISIYICNTNGGISLKAEKKLIALLKYLLKKHNLSKNAVMRHFDVSGKLCPIGLSINNWERWKHIMSSLGNEKPIEDLVNDNKAKHAPSGMVTPSEPSQPESGSGSGSDQSSQGKGDEITYINQNDGIHNIDNILGKIDEKYEVLDHVEVVQTDPNERTVTNFKQEYTVIIRKKKYYAINALEGENKYIRMYQIDNYTSINTSISCTDPNSGTCSVNIVGNTRIICAEREDQDTAGWSDYQDMIDAWAYELDDNSTVMDADGNYLYNNILYDNINDMKQAKYGWRIAEKCDFEPMDEIHIYAKSRRVKEHDGKFKVNKIFFGYISDVTKSYTAGKTCPSITIKAEDHLKLMKYSYIATKMSQNYITAVAGSHYNKDYAGNIIIDDNANADENSPQIGASPFTNVFAGKYPYEIIIRCALDSGIPESYVNKRIEKIKRIPFMPYLKENMVEIFTSDIESRLEFCKGAADKTLLEFFADEEGQLVLKIPNWVLGINHIPANNNFVEERMTQEEREAVRNGGNYVTTIEKQVTEKQTVTENTSETIYHTVVPGDTLWDIAAMYYNDNYEWPTIYDANSGQIADPHWIYPGQVLIIQRGTATTKEIEVVKTVTETKTDRHTIASITDKYIPIIYDDEVISFTLCDSDVQLSNCFQITAEVPLEQNLLPVQVTRVVQDWSSIIRFGMRPVKAISTPLLNSEVGAVLYGTMMVAKTASYRYRGSLNMIEDSSIKVGDPIRMFIYDEHPYKFTNKYLDIDKYISIFYVEKIDRTISPSDVSTMTLTLSAGRMIGMDSVYDKMYLLYKDYFTEPSVNTSSASYWEQYGTGGTGGSGSSGSGSSSSGKGGVTASGSGEGAQVANFALSFVGYPYVWGATGPDSFDCSGLMQYSYSHFGYSIGRTTYQQVNEGIAVGIGELVAGDLILFYSGPSHVGMYIGNDQFVHAANEELGVRVDTLSGYYANNVYNCRRIIH